MTDKKDIKIVNVTESIPSILLKKFQALNIENLQQVSDIKLEEFSKIKSIGKSIVSALEEYQHYINENLNEVIKLQEIKQKEYVIPLDFYKIDPNSLLELLNETVNDYLDLNDNEKVKSIIVHLYGLNGAQIYTLEELSSYFSNTPERIRQLKHETLRKLDSFLIMGRDSNIKCSTRKEVSSLYQDLKSRVLEKKILSKQIFIEILINHYGSNNKNLAIIDLLIDLFNLYTCGKVDSYFTTAIVLLANSSEKKKFLKTAETVMKFLRKEIIPQNQMQIIINSKKGTKTISNSDILSAIEILPEIEMIENDDICLYQLKFEFLSNAPDRAYRVLFENGEAMYIDNIVAEINSRLLNTSTKKLYDRHSLTLTIDRRFSALGKTGYWGLGSWNKNSFKIEDLIKKALYSLGQPSTYDEIFAEIIKDRPELKETSVRSLIGRDCLRVEADKWILKEWKQKYSDLSFSKRKKREVTNELEYRIEQRIKVIEFLKNQEFNTAPASTIIKALSKLDKRFTRISFYKLFNQTEYFSKSPFSKNVMIKLKQQNFENIIYDEFNWEAIKTKLHRDLESFFSDKSAPEYTFNLMEAIELFNKIVRVKTRVAELDGLDQRLLGNLNKFYLASSDRVDKLNYLKQFLTCLDPLLKKILFIVDKDKYNYVTSNKRGLGVVIDKLDKIDPTEERFKETRNVRKYRFGQQIQLSYSFRNHDTHDAKDWTELQIINAITSCFVFYIFTCCEYYDEIKEFVST
jgi:hypothetical protein